MSILKTPLTTLFGIKHPVMLAGMGGASGPELAAAVTNAGGIGTIGGGGLSPAALRKAIVELKECLDDKSAPFGVDLLLPKVGGGARKTNTDYTGGKLDELVSIMLEEKTALFVCAVGVPPKWVVERLHAGGVLVMNMVGAVKHVSKALASGVDLICAQGGEGGGHTGTAPTSILVPKCVDACRGHRSPLTGEPIIVVAAGGVFDGRGLSSALAMGAAGVWVGTRFVACEEAGAGKMHKDILLNAKYTDMDLRTTIYTGRPARFWNSPFLLDWEINRQAELRALLAQGIVPVPYNSEWGGVEPLPKGYSTKDWMARKAWIMGQAAGAIDEVLPAKVIVEEMVLQAAELLQRASGLVLKRAKL